ncbi:MAG TPA: hypothetical protein VFN66_03100, partial [Burkholderiales bacterium]|nr:hypothetical protein [Burkholderiales bacterium]
YLQVDVMKLVLGLLQKERFAIKRLIVINYSDIENKNLIPAGLRRIFLEIPFLLTEIVLQ